MASENIYILNNQKKEKYVYKEEQNVIFLNGNFISPDYALNEDDIFISSYHNTPLECRLEHYNIPREALVISSSRLDIDKIIDNSNENYENDYHIFSGQIIKTKNKDIKREILRNMILMSNIMYQMLNAGYLVLEDNGKIDDWIISFEEPLLKIFKIYHQIETSNPDVDLEEEFLINPAFRKNILIAMMKIIANFVISNKMTTIEEVSKIGDWSEKNTWFALKEKITLLEKS